MKNLYHLATLAALATVAVCQYHADLEKFHKACMEETKTTEADIRQFFVSGMGASEVKDNMKCHTKCLMEKQGSFKNGIYNADAALKVLLSIPELKGHESEITQAVNNCKNEKGANECDTAFKITMCIKEVKAQT